MRKAYMDKFPCDWTRDDWRDYLKDMIKQNGEASYDEFINGYNDFEYFYSGKAQACKDIFTNMFPGEDWED